MATADDVVAYMVDKQGRSDVWQLQKLLYYAQAWHLVWAGDALFDGAFQAWAHGPVLHQIYVKHKGQFAVDDWPEGLPEQMTAAERETVDIVMEHYGSLEIGELSSLVQFEAPWREARNGLDIDDQERPLIDSGRMQDYYTALWESDDATPVGQA